MREVVDCHTHLTDETKLREYLREEPDSYVVLLPVIINPTSPDIPEDIKGILRGFSKTNEDVDRFTASLDENHAEVITAMTADLDSISPSELEEMIGKKRETIPEARPIFKIVPAVANYTFQDLATKNHYGKLFEVLDKTGSILFSHLDYIRFAQATGKFQEEYNSPDQAEKLVKNHPGLRMHFAHFGGENFMIQYERSGKTHEFRRDDLWVDRIAKILDDNSQVSTGMEGLVYPAGEFRGTGAFFSYVREQGYFDRFLKSGQLVLGSDYPTNGVSAFEDMKAQAGNNYQRMIENTSSRFLWHGK